MDRPRPEIDAHRSFDEWPVDDPAGAGGGDARHEEAVDFPAVGGGRRHPRVRGALIALLAIVLVLVGSAGALVAYGRSNIQQSDIEGITAAPEGDQVTLPSGDTIQVLNVLLIGSDDRSTLSEEERARMNLDNPGGRRPDTLMLAQLEIGGTGAALLSFPRDLRVELCDGRVDKINASFAAGERSGIGPESCLVQTVTGLTGIDVHHYVEVDFRGFMEVVDVLGGVSLYLDQPMVDAKANLDVPAGCVRLTPEQALGFVRTRGYDDDFGRIARQQRFVREVVEELTRVGVLANPATLFSLVDSAADAVHTDDNLGLGGMREIALGLRRITSGDLMGQTVPGAPETIDGVSYVVVDEAAAEERFAAFRDASALRPDQPAAEPPPPVVAEVPPVEVRNGTPSNGLGASAAEVLAAAGLSTGEISNFDRSDVAATEVVHGPGMEEAAARVAEVFPGSTTREEAIEGVMLVLGADVDHAVLQERIMALTEPPPAPEPEPEPDTATEPDFIGAQAPADVDC